MTRIHTSILSALLLFATLSVNAATPSARQILDKAASVVGRKGGAAAQFTLKAAGQGTVSGTIAIKGSKFYAHTPQSSTWYDGKTQWTYVADTDEVHITTPSKSQQTQLNPYTFLTLYKKGYALSARQLKGTYEVHLVAQSAKQALQEAYVYVSAASWHPTSVRMKQNGKWFSINIRNFRSANQADATFIFPSKKYSTAEVIDLR